MKEKLMSLMKRYKLGLSLIFALLALAVLLIAQGSPQDQADRIDRALLNNPDVKFIYANTFSSEAIRTVDADCEGPRIDIAVIFLSDMTYFAYQDNGQITELRVRDAQGSKPSSIPNGKGITVGGYRLSSCDGLLVKNK